MKGRVAFLSRYLLADPRGPWTRDAALVVEDGRVAWAGRREEADLSGADVIDMGQAAILPGLVNAHAHAAMTLLRGVGDGLPLSRWLEEAVWPVEADMDEEVIYYGDVLGVAEQLRSGITSFVDFYNVRPMLRVLGDVPMRAVLTLAFMDRVKYMEEESWRRVEEVGRYLDAVREEGKGRVELALGPHAPYSCSRELLGRLAEISERFGLRVHTHVAESEEEVLATKRELGASPVEYLDSLGLVSGRLIAAHAVHASPRDAEILGRKGASVAHCPRSNARLGVGVADVGALKSAGVNVALGTDGPASSDSMDMFEEMRAMVYLQRASKRDPGAASARDALIAATLGSARAAGLGDVGALLPGFRADFVAVDLKALEARPSWDLTTNILMGAGSRALREVYLLGEAVVRGGEVMLGGLSEALERAEEFAAEELGRRQRQEDR